ncbi:Murein hydrolase activator NlpD [hydrothermal vent metagenome]|uniref:Murein hydrolase activator NlpD n=1 Tax=hydrothermal vent metagenome TaxID=652676 RepID=A0A3B0XAY6_9ZZZZ
MILKTSGVSFLLSLFFLAACGGASSRWDPLAYTVRKGDTLYSIAWRYEKDYRQVAEWNNIGAPYAIYPGQRLTMQPSNQNGSAPDRRRPQVLPETSAGEVVVIDLPSETRREPAVKKQQLVVQQDETLYAIARREGYSHHQLARWNRLKAPYFLKPGQKLRLTPPPGSLGGARQHLALARAEPAREAVVAPLTRTQIKARPITSSLHSSAPLSGAIPSKPLPNKVGRWHWPVKGPVVQTFKASDTARKGIGIRGKSGQMVNAAAAGTVVYSGNGLINYGNLVIIKHSRSFLSAYAYNQSLLVKEGDNVSSGQAIAKIGQRGASKPLLHFEIRHNGKPVDPLGYLPRS